MKAATMRRLRQLHFYLGLFFAPMLLLFAVSGALQVYRLNDAKNGNVPPTWIAWIASIHKNQAAPRAAAPKPAADHPAKAAAAPEKHNPPSTGVAALKVFAVLLAAALAISTLLGIIIALQTRSMRQTGIILLVLGTLLPIMLVKIS